MLTIGMLLGADRVAQISFEQYLIHILPLAAVTLTIRQLAISIWRHPSTSTHFLWRPMILVYGTWPVYLLATVMALARLPLGYRMTPKALGARIHPLWLLPQMIAVLLLILGAAYGFLVSREYGPPLLLLVVFLQALPQAALLWSARSSWWPAAGPVEIYSPERGAGPKRSYSAW